MEYIIPEKYFYRIHHIRPRFKAQIENVLVFMATHITDLGVLPNNEFRERLNHIIKLYPGNEKKTLKTINNWRTEISALFGLLIEGEEYTKPGLRAEELTNDQDLIKFFKIFLYNFEYPGAHLKNQEIVKMCHEGISFKPAKYIIDVFDSAMVAEDSNIYLTEEEVTHCIFNDLRVTRDQRLPLDTWRLIKNNRQNKMTYDRRGDIIRYAGDILDYMVIANLLIRRGSRLFLNTGEPTVNVFRESNRRFEGYKPYIGRRSTNIDDIRNIRIQWFEYVNESLTDVNFETDLSMFVPEALSIDRESIIIDLQEYVQRTGSISTALVGSSGESFVIAHEIEKLINNGQSNLAHLVNFIPTNLGVGYDVQSFEDDGSELRKYIEVKTTVSGSAISFNSIHITPNEWRTAKSVKDRYYIYRLSLSKHSKKLFIINNIYEKSRTGEILLHERNDGYDIRFPNTSGYEEGIFS